MMTTIISIDPGGTTGIAIMYDYPDDIELGAVSEIKFSNHHLHLWETLRDTDPDILIYEGFDWRPYRNQKVELIPVEYIGVINLFAVLTGKTVTLVEQKPHQKEWWTNDKLKRIREYQEGKPHAMDAVRHMFYYLMKHGEQRHLNSLKEL